MEEYQSIKYSNHAAKDMTLAAVTAATQIRPTLIYLAPFQQSQKNQRHSLCKRLAPTKPEIEDQTRRHSFMGATTATTINTASSSSSSSSSTITAATTTTTTPEVIIAIGKTMVTQVYEPTILTTSAATTTTTVTRNKNIVVLAEKKYRKTERDIQPHVTRNNVCTTNDNDASSRNNKYNNSNNEYSKNNSRHGVTVSLNRGCNSNSVSSCCQNVRHKLKRQTMAVEHEVLMGAKREETNKDNVKEECEKNKRNIYLENYEMFALETAATTELLSNIMRHKQQQPQFQIQSQPQKQKHHQYRHHHHQQEQEQEKEQVAMAIVQMLTKIETVPQIQIQLQIQTNDKMKIVNIPEINSTAYYSNHSTKYLHKCDDTIVIPFYRQQRPQEKLGSSSRVRTIEGQYENQKISLVEDEVEIERILTIDLLILCNNFNCCCCSNTNKIICRSISHMIIVFFRQQYKQQLYKQRKIPRTTFCLLIEMCYKRDNNNVNVGNWKKCYHNNSNNNRIENEICDIRDAVSLSLSRCHYLNKMFCDAENQLFSLLLLLILILKEEQQQQQQQKQQSSSSSSCYLDVCCMALNICYVSHLVCDDINDKVLLEIVVDCGKDDAAISMPAYVKNRYNIIDNHYNNRDNDDDIAVIINNSIKNTSCKINEMKECSLNQQQKQTLEQQFLYDSIIQHYFAECRLNNNNNNNNNNINSYSIKRTTGGTVIIIDAATVTVIVTATRDDADADADADRVADSDSVSVTKFGSITCDIAAIQLPPTNTTILTTTLKATFLSSLSLLILSLLSSLLSLSSCTINTMTLCNLFYTTTLYACRYCFSKKRDIIDDGKVSSSSTYQKQPQQQQQQQQQQQTQEQQKFCELLMITGNSTGDYVINNNKMKAMHMKYFPILTEQHLKPTSASASTFTSTSASTSTSTSTCTCTSLLLLDSHKKESFNENNENNARFNLNDLSCKIHVCKHQHCNSSCNSNNNKNDNNKNNNNNNFNNNFNSKNNRQNDSCKSNSNSSANSSHNCGNTNKCWQRRLSIIFYYVLCLNKTVMVSKCSFMWLLMITFSTSLSLSSSSSVYAWTGRNDVPTNCTFPARWEGSWFLSGYQQSIHIKGSQFSYRGRCAASDGNKYLIVDEKGCHRCLVIYEKHKNVLQYKESECEGDSMYMHQSNPSAMAMRSVLNQKTSDHRGGAHPNLNGHSRLSSSDQYIMRSNDDMNDYFCKGRETLQNLCDQIPGDALLYSLFRESAEPVKCPLKGPFIFTYNRGNGECKSPVSNIESCTEDSRLLLSFQACPDVVGTESTVEELTCLATWKDGNSRYLVGLVSHHHAISNEERYRCFVYEKISSLIDLGHFTGGAPSLSSSKDAEYKLAQSGDATCNGLDSAEVGSRIMSLRKPPVTERCDFPVWFKGPRHWHVLMGNAVYNYHTNDGSIHIIKSNGYMETRALCEQINKQTATEMMSVVHYTTGCQSGFMCMVFYRRDTHVIEIQTGKPASRLEDACAPDHFDILKTPYTTLLASNPDPQICPLEGLYNLRGAIGPPYLTTRHKRNHNNKGHNFHNHHHQWGNTDTLGLHSYGHKRHSTLSFRNANSNEKSTWHSNTRGLAMRSRRQIDNDTHKVQEVLLVGSNQTAKINLMHNNNSNNNNEANIDYLRLRNRRDIPECITNYKGQRQLWLGCTEPNIIDVRPMCSDEGDEEYSCHGSWSENGTVFIIARHKGTKHGVCISYRPTESTAAKLIIGDACFRDAPQKPPEHHLIANLTILGKCGETGSMSSRKTVNEWWHLLIITVFLICSRHWLLSHQQNRPKQLQPQQLLLR